MLEREKRDWRETSKRTKGGKGGEKRCWKKIESEKKDPEGKPEGETKR